jgi:hypothetical protein
LGETLEVSVLFRVASLLFFPVTIGVNDQQGKYNESGHEENDGEWFILPYLTYKTGEIGIHFWVNLHRARGKAKSWSKK